MNVPSMSKKPHVVCIPLPAQGHLHPMMQLAKLLHSRGFYITFVNTEFNHGRLLRSKGPDMLRGLADFRFETISDGMPPSDRDATQDPVALCDSIGKNNCLKPLLELLAKLNSSSSSSLGVPPVSYIVADGFMSFAIQAAEAFGIPEVQFWTASACGFMGYLQFKELVTRGITPLKDETYLTNGYIDTLLDWVPGMPNIRLRDMPSFATTTDPNHIIFNFTAEEAQNCLKAKAIIFNTFDDLEQEVLNAIASMFTPGVYTIGPLSLLSQQLPAETDQLKSIRLNLWKEDSECLEWLEKREPSSVIYVNFGCVAVMSEQNLIEFGWGLVNSKHPFLWVIRPDVIVGAGDSAVLPEDLVEEIIKDQGMITSWCPQDQVLSHPSVGGFLTHSGWNSTLESICGGVPMICWPFFAEQQTNCRYVCTTWEIGMETDSNVKREEVERVVKELMVGEKGKKMRNNALKWKKKAEEATKPEGSSYCNFDRLFKEVLLHPLLD